MWYNFAHKGCWYIKSMLQNMVVCVLVAVFVSLLVRGEALMSSPDCEKMLWRRALMCSSCGCNGDAIADFGDCKERATIDIRRPITGWRRPAIDSRLSDVTCRKAVGRRMPNVAQTRIVTERLPT